MVWSQAGAEGAEGGEFEECSVLLLPLHQMFTLHPHSVGTVIDYTITSGMDSHQSPQSKSRAEHSIDETDFGGQITLNLGFLHLQPSRVMGKDPAPFNGESFLKVNCAFSTQADAHGLTANGCCQE